MTSASHTANAMAWRLLRPGVLDEALRSGLFLARTPDSDCWDVLAPKLVAELQRLGAHVIFVDLTDSRAAPLELVREHLYTELLGLDRNVRLPEPDEQGLSGEKTFAALIDRLVKLSGSDVVLILDHVSRLRGRNGRDLLKALKSARDAVNLRAAAIRHFILVATDVDPCAVRELVIDQSQAFYGASIEGIPST